MERTRISPTDAAAMLAARTAPPEPEKHYRYYTPLSAAADEFAEQARTLTTGRRIYTGIDVFDQAMRGLAPRELMIVQGYAHQGKTVFATEVLRNNSKARAVLFTADEDRVLVLAKLASLVHGISAEKLEQRIADGDLEAERLVRSTAIDHFPNLVVFDDINTTDRMTRAITECRDMWGDREQLCIFDYANLLHTGGEGGGVVTDKIDALKGWGKDLAVPLMVMHQASRSRGAGGSEITIDSGAYGGEQQATFVIGVRRKRSYWGEVLRDLKERRAAAIRESPGLDDKITEAEYELQHHMNTITFNLVKNKRPPGRLVDDTDFILDSETGRLERCEKAFTSTANLPQHEVPTWDESEMF